MRVVFPGSAAKQGVWRYLATWRDAKLWPSADHEKPGAPCLHDGTAEQGLSPGLRISCDLRRWRKSVLDT